MSRQLIIRPEAEAEMAEAFDWYEDRVPGLGSDFLLSVDAVIQAAVRSPEHYPQAYCVPKATAVAPIAVIQNA